MAVISVLQSDTFEGWRVKTNQIAQNQGDLSTLNVGIASSSVVGAINNVHALIVPVNSTVIAHNSALPALKVTQSGTGNAFVVEDTASDTTPFVIDQSGNVIVGHSVQFSPIADTRLQQIGTTGGSSIVNQSRSSTDSFGPISSQCKSRSGSLGAHGIVLSGDNISRLWAYGSDGTNFIQATAIESYVDGTPGTNDMPGRLVFSTTADGASTPTERMRIDNAGNIGIGAAAPAGRILWIAKPLTGSTTSHAVTVEPTVQSDVTVGAYGQASFLHTQAANFVLPFYRHFFAGQGTLGAGSSVIDQVGFHAPSSLVGATNNYGFYGNISAGTGRWNFYANGTAANYFAGNVLIGSATNDGVNKLQVSGSGIVSNNLGIGVTPGTALDIAGSGFIRNTRTGADTAYISRRANGTVAAPTISSNGESQLLRFDFYDGADYIPAGQITCSVDGTPGTNDMPGKLVFSTSSDGSNTPTERMRIDSNGNVLVTNPAGLGYGPGAGGTVTQATSKSTAVTLNKPCGQIVMHNALMANGEGVVFQLNNTLVTTSSPVVANISGGSANPDGYTVRTRLYTGVAVFIVVNASGGSLAEPVQISFVVIKGVTA